MKTKKEAAKAAQENEIQFFENIDGLIKQAGDSLVLNTISSEEELNQLLETYNGFFIEGIEDMAAYKATKDAHKRLKSIRTSIDKERKKYTAPALKWQKDLKSIGDSFIDMIKPVEDKLKQQFEAIDDKKKAVEQKMFSDRCKSLADAGYQLVGNIYVCGVLQVQTDGLTQLTEDEINFFIKEGEKESKRKKAEEDAYNARMRELEEREARLAAREAELNKKDQEMNAQETALNETYQEIETPSVKPDPKPETECDIADALGTDEQVEKLIDDVENNEADLADSFDESYNQGFNDGFMHFQSRILDMLNQGNKMTRNQLVDWISNQELKSGDHVC